MNTETTNGFILIMHGNDWHKNLPTEKLEELSEKGMAWFKRLQEEGKATEGYPLMPEGKILAARGGRGVMDGRFKDSQEAIGGFIVLKVDEMDEAVRIGQECPALGYGARLEVRPVAAGCPLAEEARERSQFAGAHA